MTQDDMTRVQLIQYILTGYETIKNKITLYKMTRPNDLR